MKANEMPEKIYIFENPILDFTKLSVRQSDTDIEYVRKDAFIEKACVWLKNNLQGIVGGSIYIEDFENYMKGE